MKTQPCPTFAISGSIIDSNSQHGISGLKIEAWDKDLLCDDMIGSSITDQQGKFEIGFDLDYFQELFADQRPDVFFRIFQRGKLIHSTEHSVIWNMDSHGRQLTILLTLPDTQPHSTARTLRGRLSHNLHSTPLAGLTVSIIADDSEQVLASTRSDKHGNYLLSWSGPDQLSLHIQGPQGEVYATHPLARTANILNLALKIESSPPETADWRACANYLRQHNRMQLHQLVTTLSGPAPASSWSTASVAHMLQSLELAFLDPEQRLQQYAGPPTFQRLNSSAALSLYQEQLTPYLDQPAVKQALDQLRARLTVFNNLQEVDWIISLEALEQGNVSLAVNQFAGLYDTVSAASPDLADMLQMPTERSRYRDYLCTIFTGPSGGESYHNHLQRLSQRFHQDFTTLDSASQPINRLLISILKEILTAMPGHEYGFGMLANYIEAQDARSNRDYLDYLISLTQLSATELGLRYRLDFNQPDGASASPLALNIGTLQQFFRDGFQSVVDPIPIIPNTLQGKPPFFLYYQEWLRQARVFFPENSFNYRNIFIQFPDAATQQLAYNRMLGNAAAPANYYTQNYHQGWQWMAQLLSLQDSLSQAHEYYQQAEYGLAYQAYLQTREQAKALLFYHGMPLASDQWLEDVTLDDFSKHYLSSLSYYQQMLITDTDSLNAFLNTPAQVDRQQAISWSVDGRNIDNWLTQRWVYFYHQLFRCYLYELPLCLGDCALASADFLLASRHYASVSQFTPATALSDDSGYLSHDNQPALRHVPVHHHQQSVAMFDDGDIPYSVYQGENTNAGWLAEVIALGMAHLHPMIRRAAGLQHGSCLLQWADSYYRADEPASIGRARELYKSCLILHHAPVDISPHWPGQPSLIPVYQPHAENPALTSQKTHARLAFYQINAGLNYYGYHPDMVPLLRYQTLAASARRFAEHAKAAQQDFLHYTANLETLLEAALRESLLTANALHKAQLLGNIAQQQISLSNLAIEQAEQQVAAVRSAIQAKQQEIDDADSLSSQFGDFAQGFVDAVSDPEKVAAGVASGNMATGYGMFLYGSYTSMSGMADAANSRKAQLNALKYQALPAAQAMVKVRQTEKNIAQLQYQLAASDAEFAQQLSAAIRHFQQYRLLNSSLWARLAAVMRRVMRRYLDLGARYTWLAERALSYQLNQELRIVRLDYFPQSLQGITGADLLQLDLAELEARYLDQRRQSLIIQQHYSLAMDFPLALAQLKKTGQCSFRTEQQPLQHAYPGAYGYRIQHLSLQLQQLDNRSPLRGWLKNPGVSQLSQADGNNHTLSRGMEVMPISAPTTATPPAAADMLSPFEGCGISSNWSLELPLTANPGGLQQLLDIVITVRLEVAYCHRLYQQQLAAPPEPFQRQLLLSARKLQPEALQQLQQANSSTLNFAVQQLPLPDNENNRRVKNLQLFLAGRDLPAIQATLQPAEFTSAINLTLERGYINSNLGPLAGSAPASVLNPLLDQIVDQNFAVTIHPADNPSLDFSHISDVILGIEYHAHY